MKWSNISLIFRKEILDITRDRRTVMSMIVVPLVAFPLLIFGISSLMLSQMKKMESVKYTVFVVGADRSPGLIQALEGNEEISFQDFGNSETDARALLAEEAVSGVVLVPEGGLTNDSTAVEVTLLVNLSSDKGEIVQDKVVDALKDIRTGISEELLAEYKAPKTVLRPFDIVTENVATEEQMGGRILGTLLPYIMILVTFQGGIYAAIDMTAGEKEKSTLETLLVSAASRIDIVMGKFLAVMSVSIVTALISLLSMSIVMVFGLNFLAGGEASSDMAFSVDVGNVLLSGLMMLPLAALFAALLLTVCIFAKSNREAQTYVMPMAFAIIIPAMMSMMPGTELSAKMAWIPVINVSLVIKQIMMDSLDPQMISITFLSTVLYASACIFVTMKVFQKEEVLFKI